LHQEIALEHPAGSLYLKLTLVSTRPTINFEPARDASAARARDGGLTLALHSLGNENARGKSTKQPHSGDDPKTDAFDHRATSLWAIWSEPQIRFILKGPAETGGDFALPA
jgi:hypothetical protein